MTPGISTSPHAHPAQRYVMVDLTPHLNNDGTSHPAGVPHGDLSGEGMAFPWEALPASGEIVTLHGIPFQFTDTLSGAANNVCLEGQTLTVPAGAYAAVHVLGASVGGSFEEPLELECASGARETVQLRLTTCRPAWGRPLYGEADAVRFPEMHFPAGETHVASDGDNCCLWLQTAQVITRDPVVAIQLGDNDCMHVFALTLRRASGIAPQGGQ